MREPKFRLSSAPRNRAPGHNQLSATFNRYKAAGPAIATLDEALDMLDHRQRGRAAIKRRDEGVKRPPATREQLFSIAKAQAASGQRKVKLPTFSIQQHEIDA